MKQFVFIFSLSLLFFLSGYSQQYIFSNYSINEGLSQSVVNCVFQDSKGYLWIGTQDGLNKFNGETFDIFNYNPHDTNSISNNWIYSITEDQNSDLWIGTKGGLNKYLRKEKTFQRISYKTEYAQDISEYSYDVICLKNGNILINTPPVFTVINPKTKEVRSYRSKLEFDSSVKDVKIPIIDDIEGNIWIGATNGLSSFSLKTKEFQYYSFTNSDGDNYDNPNITALYKDKTGEMWAGTTTGLFKLNSNSGLFEEFKSDKHELLSLENTCIRSIIEDKNGNLILGTEGKGLFIISLYSKKQNTIQNFSSENSLLSHNIIQSLMIDNSENLWIGTLQGISKTDLKKIKFQLYRKSNMPNSLDLLGNVIASIYKDDDGILWVGNWGQGLNKIDRTNNSVEHFSTQMPNKYHISNDFVHVIFEDSQKTLWIGTRNGISIYDKTNNTFIPYYEYFKNSKLPTFQNVRIYMIIQDKADNYWIGTQNGLYKINLTSSTVEVFQKESDNNHKISANLIYCLLEDSEGLIWIATINGLDVYNPISKSIKHFQKDESGNSLCDNFIISLCEDDKGQIWIGTSSFVNMFNKKDSSFTYYSQKNGLPNNRIFEILKDKNKNLWFATGKGLCKFDEKNNLFHTFTLEEGLQSLEFNLRAAYSSKDGEVFFGGMNGFNSFYPDSLYKNQFIPNLVFTAFYKSKGIQKDYIDIENSDEVSLNYNDYSFTIEFAALEFTSPNKNRYSYMMEGISDEWIDIENRRFVPFSNLQPGEYTFRVKGSNNDEVWNNNAISLKIIISPPWWRSTYSYISYLIILIISIIAIVKVRERKLQLDKKILEQKVIERTTQINEQKELIIAKNQELNALNNTKDKFFSIIGHDLRNPFDIIMGLSEIMILDFKKMDPKNIDYYLTSIFNSSKLAHELLENLLAWARMQTGSIEYVPETFDASIKIKETVELLTPSASKKKIKIKALAKEETLIFADKNMFTTIIRNLIANAIKFTHQNGNIFVYINKKEDFQEITVEDTGVGISEENIQKLFKIDTKHATLGTEKEKGTGLGLLLCKEFIEKHGGKIWVISEIGKGTKFTFSIPITDHVK